MAEKTHNNMSKMIRTAFRRSGMSIKRLADESGVPYQSVHGTVNGTRDPALSTVERLCKVLGLELRPIKTKKRK